MGGGDSSSTSTDQRSSSSSGGSGSRTRSPRSSDRSLSAAALPFSQFENGLEDQRRENAQLSGEANEELRFEDRNRLEEEIREFGESVVRAGFELLRLDRERAEFGDRLGKLRREIEVLLAEVNGVEEA